MSTKGNPAKKKDPAANPAADAVALAQAAFEAKAAELLAAQQAVDRLVSEHTQAGAALREARVAADAALPQCKHMQIAWSTRRPKEIGVVVIVRRTPGGTLIVRAVGAAPGEESRFKWNRYTSRFEIDAKRGVCSDVHALADVPAEFVSARADR